MSKKTPKINLSIDKIETGREDEVVAQGIEDKIGPVPTEAQKVLRPSKQDYRTPKKIFKAIEKLLGVTFKLDAAATKENALCRRFYSPEKNGLAQKWDVPTFCNPPFKDFGEWIAKARTEAEIHDVPIVIIGPVGCSQSWFHDYAIYATKILVPHSRIKFDNPDGTPSHGGDRDTMIYVFDGAKIPHQPWNLVSFAIP